MSRLAKNPIKIPDGVDVQISDGSAVRVKGPLGELSMEFPPAVKIGKSDNAVVLERTENSNFAKAMIGTAASIVKNMISGVKTGFTKVLEIKGLGYGFALKGSDLIITCGYTNKVQFPLPPQVKAKVEKNVLTITSFDKQLLGRVAAEIRAVRPPEPYKGKGIRYKDEIVRKKVGKAGAGGTGVTGK
ncbi:MAG: 50S ribosomal protein L6 [Elusimicrobia bacterium]|nr:50S ribosomal protein L6 [Elusimicrobiota bacterium]